MTIKNRFDNWEVSLISFRIGHSQRYKVTRRFPQLSVAETKVFENIDDAKRQFDEWAN
jgi:hypothetical protein